MEDHSLARRRLGFWIAAMLSILLDLATKHFAFACKGTASVNGLPIIPDILHLVRHFNRGMVWGIGSGHTLLIIAIVAIIAPWLVIMAYSCKIPKAPLWALGLILGGAAGNIYDRIAYPGVRDFILVDLEFWPANPWPIFNIADAVIVIGFVYYTVWSLLISGGNSCPAPNDESITATDSEKIPGKQT